MHGNLQCNPISSIHFHQHCAHAWITGEENLKPFLHRRLGLYLTRNYVILLHPLVTNKPETQTELGLLNKPTFCDKFHQVLSLLYSKLELLLASIPWCVTARLSSS
jgi:hypothetical protein